MDFFLERFEGKTLDAAGAAGTMTALARVEDLAGSVASEDLGEAEAAAAARRAEADSLAEEAVSAAGEREEAGNMNTFPLDRDSIKQAIARAEAQTSGEIRVVVYPHLVDDPVATAKMEFIRLAMYRTRERNAVLILVAPAARAFAIFGDEGVHARCGANFWQEVAEAMVKHFRQGEFTSGVVEAVTRTGAVLARHFPHSLDDENELPDEVIDRDVVI